MRSSPTPRRSSVRLASSRAASYAARPPARTREAARRRARGRNASRVCVRARVRGQGYVKAIKRQGVERRVAAAGGSKAGLDPYMPQKKRDVANQKRLLKEIHTNFIDAVKEGRGERLDAEAAARMHHATKGGGGCGGWLGKPGKRTLKRLVRDGAGLFDGSVYSGEVGLELGLVDGVGELRTELQKRYGRFVQLERMEEERLDYSRLLRWLF